VEGLQRTRRSSGGISSPIKSTIESVPPPQSPRRSQGDKDKSADRIWAIGRAVQDSENFDR